MYTNGFSCCCYSLNQIWKWTLLEHTSINNKCSILLISNVHAKIISYLQYEHSLMMAKDQVESTRERINHGRFINQLPPDIITSIRPIEGINKKSADIFFKTIM